MKMERLSRSLRYSIWLLIIISLQCAGSLAQNAGEVARRALPSVVVVTTYDSLRHPLILASGFFVTEQIVATNFHVIEGASDADIKIVGESKLHRISGVVAVSKERDLVLLQVADVRGAPLAISTKPPEIGDEIYALGNPEALEGSISPGIVSSKGTRRVEAEDLIQITAPISHGSSGGPVVNKLAQVIGVAESFLSQGQNLNFAVPSNYLASLISEIESTPRTLTAVTNPKPRPVPRWVFFGSVGETDVYYDSGQLGEDQRGQLLTIRIKWVPKTDEARKKLSDHPTFRYQVNFDDLDCAHSASRIIRFEEYDEQGISLESIDVPEANRAWEAVKPGSMMAALIQKICSGSSPDTDVGSLVGTYTGTWASNSYPVSGALVLTMALEGGQMTARVVLTGSEYFNEDTLIFKLTPMGSGVWKMDYKGKKSKMTGTGLFRGGQFVGDYRFSKLLWVDRGRWNLQK